MANEIVVSGAADMFMPVMDIKQALMRRESLLGFVQGMLVKDRDYGVVPGTGTKPTLLKPGAEKLTTFFGLSPVFVSERIVEDFGDDGNEPLFFYRYRCELYRTGSLVGSGIGSCNSRESKYRYRNSERVCPQCGKPAITRSKFPPRDNPQADPGWYCYAKKGGCGVNFDATDRRITEQVQGKIVNPDIADIVNTIDKMAQKRALIAATLIAVNASEFFTQDVEDMNISAEYTVVSEHPAPQVTNGKPAVTAVTKEADAGAGDKPANVTYAGNAFKRYADAKDAARKAGKFTGEKHLENAWAKLFKEYGAHDPANADAFLAAFDAYVETHETEGVPSVADSLEVPA